MRDVNVSGEQVFAWHGLRFSQADDVFKIGTDALLLATWAPRVVALPDRVLDAGTGTGFLALAMARAFPHAHIEGIDRSSRSVALAERNAAMNDLAGRCVFREDDVLRIEDSTEKRHSLVVTNPPFFGRHMPSADPHEALARHRAFGPADWLKGCFGRLAPGGRLCLVVPADDAYEWIRDANADGWYVQDRLDVRVYERDERPLRTLLHFTPVLTTPRHETLAMCSAEGVWHPAFIRWREYA
jgi:tRNA1Val (adenine37-N6)-methyltransferase